VGHNAQVGGPTVQAPEVLLAVARMREESLVFALEICQELNRVFRIMNCNDCEIKLLNAMEKSKAHQQ
jgi:hypothetical protein